MKCLFSLLGLLSLSIISYSQCPDGETSVDFVVSTDNWGYEMYWELTLAEDDCGAGTIAFGGNTNVGCSNGNTGTGGYADNAVINEGPWCVATGAALVIHERDDYGDGGTQFTINIDGFPIYEFSATGYSEEFYFDATPPPPVDGALVEIETPDYVFAGGVEISGAVKNQGSTAIQSMELSFSIDGEIMGSFTASGLNIEPFTTYEYSHSDLWWGGSLGAHELSLTVSNINNLGDDAAPYNDMASKTVIVKNPIPNITASYYSLGNDFTYDVIVNSTNQVSQPRDLDFHQGGHLWVINTGTENSGGSTVKITNPWTTDQSSLWQQDGNAGHFMSLPSGIAFGNGEIFATSPSVFDANHDGGDPFTGPTLWSSNPSIYAQDSGGNGSHMDMLHESPQALGIAFESHNTYWVYDSYNQDIVRYNFEEDHGPGNSFHGDGIVHRYPGMGLERINTTIVCHLELDANERWLYFVDGGNNRVLRLDITTGTLGGNPSFSSGEDLAEYKNITGFVWEEVITTGLVEPAGIDVIDNTLIVTDHSNGDIIFYDISSMPANEIGRLETGEPGIMGVVLGPQGRIWYCNTTLNKVVRVEPDNILLGTNNLTSQFTSQIYPNPVSTSLNINIASQNEAEYIVVYDSEGRMSTRENIVSSAVSIDVRGLSPGIYFAVIGVETLSFIVE